MTLILIILTIAFGLAIGNFLQEKRGRKQAENAFKELASSYRNEQRFNKMLLEGYEPTHKRLF